MASFYKRKGLWYCDVYRYGRVSLGRNKQAASDTFRHIDLIWECRKLGLPLAPASIRFLEDASPRLRKRLRDIGLVEVDASPTLAILF